MAIVKNNKKLKAKKDIINPQLVSAKYHKVSNLDEEEKEVLKKLRKRNYQMSTELDTNTKQIKQLKDHMHDREMKMGEMALGGEMLINQEQKFKDEIDLLKREVTILKRENSELKSENEKYILQRKNEGFSMLEKETLQVEVQRLMSMLKTTKEYKEFSEIADASGSIKYLTSIGKFSKVDLACKYKELRGLDCHRPDLFVNENVLWVPSETFKFAHEFRIKYNGQLTDTLIEHLLFELNKVFSKREDKRVSEIKARYSKEAELLRRKLASTPSMDLNQALLEIKRQRLQLKEAYKTSLPIHYSKDDPKVLKNIKTALKSANDNCILKTKLNRENQYYKSVNKAYEKALGNDHKGRLLYTEGKFKTAQKGAFDASHLRDDIQEMFQDYEKQNFQDSHYKIVNEDNTESTFVPSNTAGTQKRENMLYNVMKRIEDYTTYVKDNANLDKINFQTNVNSQYQPADIPMTIQFSKSSKSKKIKQ